MTTDERLLRLENAFAMLAELAGGHHQRISNLEQSFQTLVGLARSAEERMDQHLTWINQLGDAQANSESRIAALADAQIKTDEALTRLAEAQAHTDQRLDALIDIVREWRNGKS
jgi:DNA repair exonuclease SbcCD ATPase subunit